MFDNLFPLLGHTAIVLSLVSALGVLASVAVTELVGATLRGRRPS
jgi:hypothetical protein